jgi:hypothetical protein
MFGVDDDVEDRVRGKLAEPEIPLTATEQVVEWYKEMRQVAGGNTQAAALLVVARVLLERA